MSLAPYVGPANVPLGFQRIYGKVESMIGTLPGVDCAPGCTTRDGVGCDHRDLQVSPPNARGASRMRIRPSGSAWIYDVRTVVNITWASLRNENRAPITWCACPCSKS